jgi:hypothetical protein
MSYNPANPNGQATSANSSPVVLASDQTAISSNITKVNGTIISLGQTTNSASLPVTIASDYQSDLFVTGQSAQTATINNIIPAVAGSTSTDTLGFGAVSVQVNSTGLGGAYIFEGSNDNSNFQALPVYNLTVQTGTPIVGAITAASGQIIYTFPINFRYLRLRITTAITGGSIQAFTRLFNAPWTAPTLQVAQATAGNLKMDISGSAANSTAGLISAKIDQTTDGTTNKVSGGALAKGTQGTNGFTTQDLKDAGRTTIILYAVAVATGASGVETAISLTESAGTGATTTAVSFTPTSGKRFRITQISVATRGSVTATIQTTTFSFRINTAGAVTTTSSPVIFSARSATPATASAWDRYTIPIPDGLEIAGNGTLQFGMTANSTYITNAPTLDVNIVGFEY